MLGMYGHVCVFLMSELLTSSKFTMFSGFDSSVSYNPNYPCILAEGSFIPVLIATMNSQVTQ